MPINTNAPGMPCAFTVAENSQVCLWDWDAVSSDDLLWSFPVDSTQVGQHQGSYYNGLQDCLYYLDYTIEAA